jgi:hypothetical protein
MALTANEISNLVFRRVSSSGKTQFSLSSQMIDVLTVLDGQRNLGQASQETGYDFGLVKAVVAQLLKMKLIELVPVSSPSVDEEFMAFLSKALSMAIGPLAAVLIEDARSDLGHPEGPLPQDRAAELVDLLAREINQPEKRNQFQVKMVGKLKSKGYFA